MIEMMPIASQPTALSLVTAPALIVLGALAWGLLVGDRSLSRRRRLDERWAGLKRPQREGSVSR